LVPRRLATDSALPLTQSTNSAREVSDWASLKTDLAGFLGRWYGPPSHAPQQREIPGVPAALCGWYAAEDAWGRRLAVQNTILKAPELVAEDGLTVFYVENQGVWHWAFASGTDPDVSDRENEPRVPWSPTGATLSEFLVHAAMFEAIFASKIGASAIDIDRAHYDSVVGPLGPVPMTPWNWPGPECRLFVSDRLLAVCAVNDRPGTRVTPDSLYWLMVGAKSNDDLAYLDQLDIKWAHNTRLFGEGIYC